MVVKKLISIRYSILSEIYVTYYLFYDYETHFHIIMNVREKDTLHADNAEFNTVYNSLLVR